MIQWSLAIVAEKVIPFYKSNCPALMPYCQLLDDKVVKPMMENTDVSFRLADITTLEIPRHCQL